MANKSGFFCSRQEYVDMLNQCDCNISELARRLGRPRPWVQSIKNRFDPPVVIDSYRRAR